MAFRLRWPTQYGQITQEFMARPAYYAQFPYLGVDGHMYRLPGHEGVDLKAPDGSQVRAGAAGTVTVVRLDGDSDPLNKPYGNQIRIQHADGFQTIYAHLQSVAVAV